MPDPRYDYRPEDKSDHGTLKAWRQQGIELKSPSRARSWIATAAIVAVVVGIVLAGSC